jgi:hypothetical protein
MAFIMAFERKAAEKKWDLTKPLNDVQVNEIVQESFRLGMNLGAGNKAKWQEGVMGLVTQFWQVSHKYYENMFYGMKAAGSKENQWTKLETATAVFMNALLFGAAGYGLDEWTGGLDRWLYSPEGMGLDPENPEDEKVATLMRGGMLEALSLEGLGFTLDISDRTGPASGINTVYKNLVEPGIQLFVGSDNATDDVGKMLLGATGTIRTRFANAFNKTLMLLSNDISNFQLDDVTVMGVAYEWAQMATSVSNIQKARIWKHTHDIVTSNGRRLFVSQNGEEIPMSVMLAQSLGFAPLAKEIRELQEMDSKKRDKDYADTAKLIVQEYRGYFTEDGALVGEQLREAHARRAALLLGSYDSWERQKVLTKVAEEFMNQGMEQDVFQEKLLQQLWDAEPYTDKEKEIRESVKVITDAAKL